MTAELEAVARVWPEVQGMLAAPHTEAEYNRLVIDGTVRGVF